MNFKERVRQLYLAIDKRFQEQFGFCVKNTSFLNIVEYLHRPKDASSLAVTRILFGLAMLFDISDERGGATMVQRWDTPACHFPLLPFVQAVPMPYMALVYAALWIGALGIMLGYKYRISSAMFTIIYWYLFIIEKSFWNNHSYLFGLVGLLLSCTQANCYWSLDTYLNPTNSRETVPYWNYFILKYQFFILYFMAGMKKGTAEWLTGYSVPKLAEHWVFDPFKIFFTVAQIDYLIVHWFIFVFDLTVAIWMMRARTRHIAMVFCAMFHLMNTRLFRIGMFPWVCLATMPLYYPFDWPKIVIHYLKIQYKNISNVINTFWSTIKICKTCSCRATQETVSEDEIINDDDVFIEENGTKLDDPVHANESTKFQVDRLPKHSDENTVSEEIKDDMDVTKNLPSNYDVAIKGSDNDKPIDADPRKKITTCIIMMYVLTQAFLPYSHFITKGYNNWTDGLYGYSWDMMVHTWDTQSVVVKIVDNEDSQEYYLDPSHYTPNDRWTRHGDMMYQYAQCLEKILLKEREKFSDPGISENISIYIDIWCSMNGRFTQRLFDPKVDLLRASWSPFSKVSYLMPLLDEALHWRSTLQEITEAVHSWNNNNEVLFFAEFPSYDQEKYISVELGNVTLTVLEGTVVYEPEATGQLGQSYRLTTGDKINVLPGFFHKVINIGQDPAYYMYIFKNITDTNSTSEVKIKPKLPVMNELLARIKGMLIFVSLITSSLFQLIFGCSEC